MPGRTPRPEDRFAPPGLLCATPRIGSDESGKGDYFGPLSVAAVLVTPQTEAALTELGVRDSKRLLDSRIAELAPAIRSRCPHDLVLINPSRYNELHRKLGNLNRLLAWAHARAIENLLERVECELVVADQFGDVGFLERAMMERGRRVRLVQRVRAESDPAVAAASVLARAAFLERLERLSTMAGIALPKGATHVLPAARQVIEQGGLELLGQVAKLHFRTTEQVTGMRVDARTPTSPT